MVFWRSRSEKKIETPVSVETEVAAADPVVEPAKAEATEAPSNVVTLVTNRLADRLADVAIINTREIASNIRKSKGDAGAEANDRTRFAGQQSAVAKIRAAFSAETAEPMLILGEPGLGRKDMVKALAGEVVAGGAGTDWIYILDKNAPSRAKAIAISDGEGARFVRDVRVAIEKAAKVFERYIKSDDHRITIDLLEEETRYRGEKAVEHIRRRAEEQNIAVVKSLDGYVLAPMHEGRVVRSDIFRALPEDLKRNVESKINALEDELQTVVATLPDVELEAHERYGALIRQTASRAIDPSLAAVRQTFADDLAAVEALDDVQDAFVALAVTGAPTDRMLGLILDMSAPDKAAAGDNVVIATHVSAADFLGEIGSDASGRVTLMPGYLARARSGTVIVEAWKLAADPKAWTALSSALSRQEFAPLSAPGLALKADATPLAATVVLIADQQSWSKLEAIEPGIARRFPHVVKLAATAPLADFGEKEFGKFVARICADNALKSVDEASATLLHKDAVRRGGGRVSLSRSALLKVLRAAHAIARGHASIRVSDLTEVMSQQADGDTP